MWRHKRLKGDEGRLEKETSACGSHQLECNNHTQGSCFGQVDVKPIAKCLQCNTNPDEFQVSPGPVHDQTGNHGNDCLCQSDGYNAVSGFQRGSALGGLEVEWEIEFGGENGLRMC